MKLRRLPAAIASFALLSALTASAQTPSVPQFTDPANLRGERVKPRDGRELPIDQGARGLEQMLRKLNTRASLMLIVAHPDDEDGGMLTYYSRGLGARVAVLTLTRGEGGQNAMTGDFEDALGLLRTQELLSADRYLGVDQFFGTEVDFGFSKTKEEAFKKWTHERVLYDAVRSIRLYRPLVIAAVFIGGVTDGHGQHQVSGQIAQEAFKAAADPTVFPDMIAEGILPWQALKVYARVPMQSISDKGLFDYATGKYTAPRFENYVTGEITTTTPSADVIVHEGTTDPILADNPSDPPRTYVQFARIGLGMQKSQIGGNARVPPPGAFDVSYHLYGSVLCTSPDTPKGCHPERSAKRGVEGPAVPYSHKPESVSFFDGIDTSLEEIADLAPSETNLMLRVPLRELQNQFSEAAKSFDTKHPDAVAPKLAEAMKSLQYLITKETRSVFKSDEKKSVLQALHILATQTNQALILALGIQFQSDLDTSTQSNMAPDSIANPVVSADVALGTYITVKTTIDLGTTPTDDPGTLKILGLYPTMKDRRSIMFPTTEGCFPHADIVGTPCELVARKSRPYFSRPNIEQPYYSLDQPNLRNAPLTPPYSSRSATIHYNGCDIELEAYVTTATSLPSGEVTRQPITWVPAISISPASLAKVMIRGQTENDLTAELHRSNPSPTTVTIHKPSSWTSDPESTDLKTADKDEWVSFHLRSTTAVVNEQNFDFVADSTIGRTRRVSFKESVRSVGYPGLPTTNYYAPATVRIVPVDLNLPHGTRVAFLPGTGDAVPEALASINLKPDILTVADLTPTNLARYDTVILGVRTYAAHPDLHGAPTQALLDYARNGGNVLVQYQTGEFTAADAPYPLALGSAEKVVDEADAVQLLDPASPLLSTPNRITPADFNNWIEERGHGFLSTWDSRYTALTETHDPGQDPQRGGLITTQLGKGRWTYCAFALYRQLPEAVPGSYRLFVNLMNPVSTHRAGNSRHNLPIWEKLVE